MAEDMDTILGMAFGQKKPAKPERKGFTRRLDAPDRDLSWAHQVELVQDEEKLDTNAKKAEFDRKVDEAAAPDFMSDLQDI